MIRALNLGYTGDHWECPQAAMALLRISLTIGGSEEEFSLEGCEGEGRGPDSS